MNSTTSLPLTSFSMNCSIAMECLLFRAAHLGAAHPSGTICSVAAARAQGPPSPRRSLFHRRVEGAFDLENVVLIEAVDLDDGARRIGAVTPQLLLHLVHQRAK